MVVVNDCGVGCALKVTFFWGRISKLYVIDDNGNFGYEVDFSF